jgi:hypothetical protein
MTKRIMSTFAALALVVAALVTAGTMTATATETGGHCTTQYSGWVTESPGEGWVKIHTRTVTDKAAYDETVIDKPGYDKTIIVKAAYDETVPGKWWNWSPNHNQAPFDGPPSFPNDSRGTWQGPHTNGGPAGTGTYKTGGGHGSWFHREPATVIHHPAETKVIHVPAETHVVHHPAVTHQEYKYKKVTCPPGDDTKIAGTPHASGAADDCDENPFGTITVDAAEGVFYTLQDGSTISGTIAANGTNTVTAHVETGYKFADDTQTEWTFTSNPAEDCPGPPQIAQFSAFSEPTPPTCDEPGSFSQIAVPGVRFTVSPEYNGPGTYTVTATLDNPEAFTFPDGTTAPKSTTVTVSPATGVTQSSNSEAPCYQAPGTPPGDDTPGTPGTPGDDTPAAGTGIPASNGSPAVPVGTVPSSGVPTSIDAGQ